MDALLQLTGAALTSNKSLRFPIQVTVTRPDFQTALATAWSVLRRVGELAGGWSCGHGRLVFTPVMEEPESGARLACRFLVAEASVGLEIEAGLELVFDFQANVWQRLEAVAGVMDFLRGVQGVVGDRDVGICAVADGAVNSG
jgi:hypothetical protein